MKRLRTARPLESRATGRGRSVAWLLLSVTACSGRVSNSGVSGGSPEGSSGATSAEVATGAVRESGSTVSTGTVASAAPASGANMDAGDASNRYCNDGRDTPCCAGSGPGCAPGICEINLDGLVSCLPCGGPSDICCSGKTCAAGGCCVTNQCSPPGSACPEDAGTCSDGGCVPPCGEPGQPCCEWSRCSDGGCCVFGSTYGEQTCVASGTRCGGLGVCQAGSCGGCGGSGEPCCTPQSDALAGPTFCSAPSTSCGSNALPATCAPCGGVEQSCCFTGDSTLCQGTLTCSAALGICVMVL
jgi:hypothetical protein